MKLIIDVDDKDYAMLKNTSITLDWNTIWHGKEKDKELTFAIFNLIKALVDGLPYEEKPQGEWKEYKPLELDYNVQCAVENLKTAYWSNEPEKDAKNFTEAEDIIISAICHHGYTVCKQPQGEWIPCSERLPDDMKKVLVWYEYYRYGDFNCMYQTYGFCYVCDGKWSSFINGETGWTDARIIAWQPLPEPYDSEVHDD